MFLYGLHKRTAKWVELYEVPRVDAGNRLLALSEYLRQPEPGCLLDNGDGIHCRFVVVSTDFSAFKIEGE